MRITRETLLKLAHDTALDRVRLNRRIVCVYLTGSLLHEEPLLGGAGDIDLFVIHDTQPTVEREIIRLSDDIHLDIAHLSQDMFHQPRQLRTHPWISPFITSHPIVYHDVQHWFEFAQAAITSQFSEPGNVLARARQLSEAARMAWLEANSTQSATPPMVWKFLKSMEHAGNAIASLTGSPLTERRFLLEFAPRTVTLGRPELSSDMLALLAPLPVEDADWNAWQPAWQAAFNSASRQADCPPRLAPVRIHYYQRAALTLREQNPFAALWICLRSWTEAAAALPTGDPALTAWQNALPALDLAEGGFHTRLGALDTYLDHVEETLDEYARQTGA
jgi:hypothetical protein